MSGLGISELPLPPTPYRADLVHHEAGLKFETEQCSRKEDAERVRRLRRSAEAATIQGNRNDALELADRLDYGDGEPPQTLASHLFMRDQRIRVCGGLWQLADDPQFGQCSTVALSPRTLEIRAGDLRHKNPRDLMAAFRTDLNNCGARYADGYLAAFLDAEYEPTTDVLRIHFHALAAGGMLNVVERLRGLNKYQSTAVRPGHRKKVPRVVLSRKPLENLPAPLTYLLKSFWSSRWEGQIDGEQRRQNRKSRIREPRHSQVLHWLDRWNLKDISVFVGLRVSRYGFRPTKSGTYTNGEVK